MTAAPLFSGAFTAYHDMHFHVQRTPAISKNNSVLLVENLCTVTVDLLRMLYVLASEEAKAANMARFNVFFELAEEHLNELDSLTTRLAVFIAVADHELIIKAQRQSSWVLGQLKRRSDVNFDIYRCFAVMQGVVNDVYQLFTRQVSEDLSRAEDVVLLAFGHSPVIHHQIGGIENLRLRLSVQSKVLEQKGGAIGTIGHDFLQSYSLYYFLIDFRILSAKS